MQPEIHDITTVDRLVHEPSRLAILAVLASVATADFKALHHLTGLTKGNLSAQLQKLEAAGYITIVKGYHGRTPATNCAITATGTQALRVTMRRYQALGRTLALQDEPAPPATP